MRKIFLFLLLVLPIQAVWAQDESQVTVERLTTTTTSWNGAPLPAYPAGNPEITMERYTIPGNTSLPWHQHPVISAGVILSGELTVETRDGHRIRLKAGDAPVETVNTWHRGINEHDEPVELIVFYAGIVDEPLTVRE